MNDSEYFHQYLQFFANTFNLATEERVFIKDANFNYQFVNDNLLQLWGMSTFSELSQLSASELLHKLGVADEKSAAEFIKQDLKVYTTKQAASFLDIVPNAGGAKLFVVYKMPIINPATNNCVGIRGQVVDLIWPHAVKVLLTMHGSKGLLLGPKETNLKTFKNYGLSSKLHMILFLCLHNYSYSEIAVFMNQFGYKKITPVRVNDYLEQLKLIFHVRNKNQLIEKALGLNFHLYLPAGLFSKSISIELANNYRAKIIDADSLR